MFDFSWAELLVVALVAILVIGPNDIPKVMMSLGRMMRKMQHIRYALTNHFDDVMRAVDVDEMRKYNEETSHTTPDTDEHESDMDADIVPVIKKGDFDGR